MNGDMQCYYAIYLFHCHIQGRI